MELRLALPLIGEAGDSQFSYNAAIINGDSIVQVEAVEQAVEEVLNNLLGPGIRYKVLGNHVVLLSDRSKKLPKSDRKIEYTISGYIYDANTGEIISQASIYEIDKMFVSVTNKEGYYSLKIPTDQEKRVLSYSKRGYNDTLIVVRPSEQLSVDINLVPKSIHTLEPLDNTQHTPGIHQRPLVAALVPGRAITSSENIQVIEERAFQVSLLPFVGSRYDRRFPGAGFIFVLRFLGIYPGPDVLLDRYLGGSSTYVCSG